MLSAGIDTQRHCRKTNLERNVNDLDAEHYCGESHAMSRNLALLLLSVCLASAGQVLFKVGASRSKALLDFINPSVVGGLVCYAVSTLIWVWVLSRVPLSTAYAFTALTFVLVYLACWLLLGETITFQTTAGLVFILFGIILISLAARG